MTSRLNPRRSFVAAGRYLGGWLEALRRYLLEWLALDAVEIRNGAVHVERVVKRIAHEKITGPEEWRVELGRGGVDRQREKRVALERKITKDPRLCALDVERKIIDDGRRAILVQHVRERFRPDDRDLSFLALRND